jgi:hypothetical protein
VQPSLSSQLDRPGSSECPLAELCVKLDPSSSDNTATDNWVSNFNNCSSEARVHIVNSLAGLHRGENGGNGGGGGSDGWAVVGELVAIGGCILILIVIVYCCCCRGSVGVGNRMFQQMISLEL